MFRLVFVPAISFLLAIPPLVVAAQEEDFRLALPIDCTPGEDCVVQNYVDSDPGPGVADFSCGPLSYDGHKGTDFRLATIARQGEGVDVLAAAPGVVQGTRNNMPDILQGWDGAPDLGGRDCGNGLVIDHGDGWETQYCHMARGSVAVSPGDRVETGDRLGLVGLSGQSQFPHLHISVRRNGEVVDPFDPEGRAECGAAPTQTLWAEPLGYVPGGLLDAGTAPGVPEWEAVQSGTANGEIGSDTPLVLWGFVFGAREGDRLRLAIEGPQGEVIDEEMPLDRTQAQLFRAAGLRAPEGGWPDGRYEGRVTLLRGDRVLGEQVVPIEIGS
ncbi:M23 family metallopeptidase [Limimaricola sp. G21655-S1]|uniref:M23 family metallopeptidase n=1 Tax=Limimaricola sp. G21655-S1 TaxID=3014768 RepID=UPI0022B066D4|nr:M23 family metallopeptidase [Limimaricola sp. G21655-S1]MCZ4259613.1 M23 family metallopeptidase [Limimaricola sp. G21655-S1]